MTLSLGNITLDCNDTVKVATFWSAALNRPLDDNASEFFVSIGQTEPGQTGWFFIKVPEDKNVKNRMHVDLRAGDRDLEITRLIALGATEYRRYDEWGHVWTTLFDPEGNEFCVS